MTALSLTVFVAIVTLAPAVFGALIVALGLAGYATRRLALALAIVGALVPLVGVPFLAAEVAFGFPIAVRPFGLGTGFGAWIVPTYRLDAFAVFAAIGVAFVVLPSLLWLAFAQRSQPEDEEDLSEVDGVEDGDDSDSEDASAASPGAAGVVPEDEAQDDAAGAPDPKASPAFDWHTFIGLDDIVAPHLWRGAGLALVLGAAALTGIFADSLVLMGIAWIVAVALAWGIGEAATDADQLDRPGLVISLVGPALWLVVMLFAAHAANAMRLLDLMGRTPLNTFECILLAIAFALAGGAYPAIAWVRRRAALATPAGIAALTMLVLPAVLYVAARTYAIAADGLNRWPIIGAAPQGSGAPPPITAGIAFALLGAVTVVISGLLAVGRRDARALLALLAVAQVGWGLVGLGAGGATALLGVVALLATAVLGLGAMIASLVAGGVLTTDIEPEADGPRPVGTPLRPLPLAAWSIGALSLIGAPLLAGFAPRQLIAAGVLQATGLNIPLGAICWAGDALLALALLRVTAPALAESGAALQSRFGGLLAGATVADLPAALLALVALLAGIFPGLLLGLYAGVASAPLLASGAVGSLPTANALGYTVGPTQWLSGVAWLAVAIVALGVIVLQPGAGRVSAPIFRGGREEAPGGVTEPEVELEAEGETEAETLVDPVAAWSDLEHVFDSSWTLPANEWLLAGIDEDEIEDEDDEGGEEDEAQAEDDGGPDGASVVISGPSDEVTRGKN